jgi:hypothetical protein
MTTMMTQTFQTLEDIDARIQIRYHCHSKPDPFHFFGNEHDFSENRIIVHEIIAKAIDDGLLGTDWSIYQGNDGRIDKMYIDDDSLCILSRYLILRMLRMPLPPHMPIKLSDLPDLPSTLMNLTCYKDDDEPYLK